MASYASDESLYLPMREPEEKTLKESKLPSDSLGPTYFVKFYGFDRLWLVAYLTSAIFTPLIRFLDEVREGSHRRYDFMVWADLFLCMMGLVLLFSIVKAVESQVFVNMHTEFGHPAHPVWAPIMKALAVVNLVRVVAPASTGDSPFATYSHVGGVFELSVGVFTLPFGYGVYHMTTTCAYRIIQEIHDPGEKGKWVRVMRKLQHFRSDMILLWSLGSVGLPWCVIIATALSGAYFNGVLFLQTREPQRAIFFFVYASVVLVVLLPLAYVTNACSRQISRAATKWYPPPDHGDEVVLPEDVFQSYTLVLDFLDRKYIGASLLGYPITLNLLRDYILKALLGLPALYHALVAVTGAAETQSE